MPAGGGSKSYTFKSKSQRSSSNLSGGETTPPSDPAVKTNSNSANTNKTFQSSSSSSSLSAHSQPTTSDSPGPPRKKQMSPRKSPTTPTASSHNNNNNNGQYDRNLEDISLDSPLKEQQKQKQLAEVVGSIKITRSEPSLFDISLNDTDNSSISKAKPPPSSSTKPSTLFQDSLWSSYSLNNNSSAVSLDKAISLTRPRTLPPKHPLEERKHIKEHKEMMKQAKIKDEMERMRKEQAKRKRDQKEKRIIRIWQEEILPKWPKTRDERRTHEIWWDGIPPVIRGKVWQLAVKNDLRLTRDMFDSLLRRAKVLLARRKSSIASLPTATTSASPSPASHDFDNVEIVVSPPALPIGISYSQTASTANQEREQERILIESLELIKLDASRTFPALGLFQDHGPLQEDLISVLEAFAVYRVDLGYVQGMSFHAAMFLINLDIADTFIAMANLFSKPFFTSFYMLDHVKIERYYSVFKMFFGQFMPELYLHFVKLNIDMNFFLLEWFLSLYSRSLPIEVAMRIWDCYFLHGEVFLMRAGLGILKYFEKDLMEGGFDHVVYFLTHLPADMDADKIFDCIKHIHIASDKYFSLLGTIENK